MNLDECIGSIEALRRRPRERSVKKLVRPPAARRNSRVLYLITNEDEEEKQREETTRKRPSGEGTLCRRSRSQPQQHNSSRPPPPSWRQAFLPTVRKREEMTAEEGDKSFLERMLSHLRSTSKYYTGYPKDLGPSRIVHFTSERHFVQLLHEGSPVVVAFTIRCPYTKHLDKVLEEAAAEFYPHFKFVRVECPKYPAFCLTRQRNEYPFIEIFYSPEQATGQGKVVDPNITKYSVKVLPFNYDVSVYGFREFFKRHGMNLPETK
ncbi:uncharacterized protein LOC135606568 isoform X3 [Musa acuminata AAA Group]|uniref:uncharacterized protein LOC103975568 isoform X3 n=1 Tax=Musa acuminata AAA Group TaxID=214697 RepID=UPI0031D80D13